MFSDFAETLRLKSDKDNPHRENLEREKLQQTAFDIFAS